MAQKTDNENRLEIAAKLAAALLITDTLSMEEALKMVQKNAGAIMNTAQVLINANKNKTQSLQK